ncbi:Glycosyltransferase involved in cell wall bisynthesis [Dyella sp. OK004]|uniref:glycosyltransferase family 4 protein n=1 Tax=Dyella sp. OK004 TaxID=1855292 RepID=UPI0008EC7B21|nr:glycosyltransferase family 4 protein [Dyella sp. OK004]SFS11567.1 Glycosyltransferase involved in cell wall bisynthesis [Dyella sp. OK004]
MKIILFANTDWYLYNFRLSTALHLKQGGHDVILLSPPGDYGHRFASYGLRWIALPMQRSGLNPLRELRTVYALVALLKQEKPGLLHSFTVKSAIYGAIAARMAGVPAVVNAVAGMGYVFASESLKARLLRPLVRLLMRVTMGQGHSLLILQNPDDAKMFVDEGLVPEEKLRIILSSGVNTMQFRPVERRASPKRPLRVLLAARLLWAKGIREYVEAARLLKDKGRDIEFLIAGMPDTGNPQSVTTEQILAWSEAGIVTWLGHMADMHAFLPSADVMALPSYYREGVPKSLIEAAACGLAIVTTDRPGCREVVARDGIDGLLVEPRDEQSLAHAIARLDDDRDLLHQLGIQARRNALKHFDERIVISKTMDVYTELLPEFRNDDANAWQPDAACMHTIGQTEGWVESDHVPAPSRPVS